MHFGLADLLSQVFNYGMPNKQEIYKKGLIANQTRPITAPITTDQAASLVKLRRKYQFL